MPHSLRCVGISLVAAVMLPISGCSRGENTLTKEEHYEGGTLKSKTSYVIRDGQEILWGESVAYYPNGQISSLCDYGDGKRHGRYEEYYEDGRPRAKGTFAYGNRDGEWTEWDDKGNATTRTYKNGRDIALKDPRNPNAAP